jgi:hypothetical protein
MRRRDRRCRVERTTVCKGDTAAAPCCRARDSGPQAYLHPSLKSHKRTILSTLLQSGSQTLSTLQLRRSAGQTCPAYFRTVSGDDGQQCHSKAHAHLGSGESDEVVKRRAGKGPIKTASPIHPRAGAMCLWVIIALPAQAHFSHKSGYGGSSSAVRACRRGPYPHAPQTLGTSTLTRSVIRLPHPLVDLSQRVAHGVGGPLPDVETRMEKIEEHRDRGDEGLASALRRLPAIGMDGLRRLIGIHGPRFAGKNAPLNLSHFVARKIWRRRGVSPLCGRAHRLQRREPLQGLLVPMDIAIDLLQTALGQGDQNTAPRPENCDLPACW